MATIAQVTRLRRRKPGDLKQLKAVLWNVLIEAESIALDRTLEAATRLKAIHGLSTAAGTYLKTLELADLEARLEQLEERVQALGGQV
ncbi:MAG: hypothetical protein KatS3mg070_1555 [Meiothermus sp.]|uniref:hypothetical protein n=1 Tax=Meiothermus sp. TaxID=1955249 RepID=UPI0021DF2EDB|nr:hypothetical protein [Meiothermus sp.]GIW28192.1 MAG: hypothetical protein KatS3mg070_1555 [Meiothermus sp.]